MISHRTLLSILLLAVTLCGSQPAFVAAQAKKIPKPKTASELALMRAYYDKTVWKKEVMAQDYEKSITRLWDQLNQPSNKYQSLATAKFDTIAIAKVPSVNKLDWGISLTKFSGREELAYADWLALLQTYAERGYRIDSTEWHHSEFTPPTASQAAKSVFSIVIYSIRAEDQPERKQRFVVKGDLHIQWSTERDPATEMFEPVFVDATRLTVLQCSRPDAFVYRDAMTFRQDPSGKSDAPVTIHPIILQDLNGDHLPEIAVVGANKVYWNKGDWQFEAAELTQYPTKYVNGAIFGDFSGDGELDLVCAPKNGEPRLYIGAAGGKFDSPGRAIKVSPGKLVNPVGITAGDIDADGDLDLFIGQNRVGYQTGDVPKPYDDARDSFPSHLLLNDGNGGFREVTKFSGIAGKHTRRNFACSLVDLDDDQDMDLLLTNDFHGNDLFLNDGEGVFTDSTNSLRPTSIGHGMSHTFGDYNLDGQLDFLFVAMSSTTARRLDKLQIGPSQFPEQNRSRKHMGYGNRLYLAEQGGSFGQAPYNADVARTGWSWGSTTFDFDRDGDQDVYIANGQTSGKTTRDYCTRYWCHDLYHPVQELQKPVLKDFFKRMAPAFSGRSISWNGYEHNALLMNLDGKGFVNVGFLMNCGSVLDSRTTVSGDIDLDGKVDVLFEHLEATTGKSTLHLLQNNWQDTHHWLGVHLPPSAYGAKVKLKLADGRTLLQHHVSGHSVWAQHPSTIHFGLGKSSVETMEVIWPGGETKLIRQPESDQYITVRP